jgi:signal transduction histidine kinase
MRPGSPVGYARARRAAGAWEETLDAFIVTLGVAAPLWPLVFEGVAHDFNNLLAAIRGYAELAARQGSDRPRLLESLEGITTTVGRASS